VLVVVPFALVLVPFALVLEAGAMIAMLVVNRTEQNRTEERLQK
jgi:hypothetical protein